jgi:heme-degrading monooxygenase HmoA
MHIVVSTLPLKRPLSPEEVARLKRELPSVVGDRPGYREVYWAQTGETEALTVSVWDSQADADAAFEAIRPWLGAMLGPILAGAPQRRVAEVLVVHSTAGH